MANDELANALELARNLREDNARLQRELTAALDQLEAAADDLYTAEAPRSALVPQTEPFAELLPFTPEYNAPE